MKSACAIAMLSPLDPLLHHVNGGTFSGKITEIIFGVKENSSSSCSNDGIIVLFFFPIHNDEPLRALLNCICHPLAIRTETECAFKYAVVVPLFFPIHDDKLFHAYARDIPYSLAIRAEAECTEHDSIVWLLLFSIHDDELLRAYARRIRHPLAIRADLKERSPHPCSKINRNNQPLGYDPLGHCLLHKLLYACKQETQPVARASANARTCARYPLPTAPLRLRPSPGRGCQSDRG